MDRWSEGSQVYFLTHLHADHTNGLSATWNKGPIFCSRLTAKLFPFKFPAFNLSLLRILEIGSWHSVSLVSPTTRLQTVVHVMAIDANHCPGAVMYLFRGESGCILCTGDFRWESTSERALIGRAMLVKALNGDKVDILYLDNTYCNPSYSFPSREVAAQQVVEIIASHPEYDIIIGIDSLGKEDLLLYISRMLKIKIWVWPERLQTMDLLGFHGSFTTKTSLTRVRAVPRYSFSIDTLEKLNTFRPTIGIMPSGLPWMVKSHERNQNPFDSSLPERNKKVICNNINRQIGGKMTTVERFHKYIYTVPYSDHSCFNEIKEFIKVAKPSQIKGIVSSSSCYVDPHYYFGDLCRGKQQSRRLIEGQEGERVESKCLSGCNIENKRKRGRSIKFCILDVRISRFSALRRKRRGAKILDIDSVSLIEPT